MHFLQPRYVVAFIIAVSIDAFELLIGIAIWAAFTTPGAAGAIFGCALGANYLPINSAALGCGIGSFIGGAIHLLGDAFSGGALQGFLIEIGGGLSAVIDFCISATFGTGLVVMMIFTGMISPGKFFSWRRTPFIIAKLLPGIDMIPGYTGMVVMTVLENEALRLAGAGKSSSPVTAIRAESIAAPSLAGTNRRSGAATLQMEQGRQEAPASRTESARARTPFVDGVRAGARTRRTAPIATSAPAAPPEVPGNAPRTLGAQNAASMALMSRTT